MSIIASSESLPPCLPPPGGARLLLRCGGTRLLLRLGAAPGLLYGLAAFFAALARRAAIRSAWSSLSPKPSSAPGDVKGLFGARREVVRRGVLIVPAGARSDTYTPFCPPLRN